MNREFVLDNYMSTLKLPTIPDFDLQSADAARSRQNILTKPLGSLGRLEALSIQLAGIYGIPHPSPVRKAVIIMAGDHGVTQEGVSAYPSAVTVQMVLNFLQGGAAINVLSRQAGARVIVVDIGIAADLEEKVAGLLRRKIAYGTQNMCQKPAMTRQQAEDSLQVGISVVEAEIEKGLDLVAAGEMGIGNTTPSTAMTAVFTKSPVPLVTGRGTGLDDRGLERKIEVIQKSIDVNNPDPQDPIDVLSKVGGFEIGGLAGVILSAAAHRIPIVLDGFISGVAALLATELSPGVKPFLIASHLSVEKGHHVLLDHIGLKPLLDLDLRLGEGTGAVLAFHLVEAAARILNEMATFSEAGVDNRK
jgi:nicotinate-nucleotide--dimethylbenzimidazole phosphoribosyltransferase